MHDTSLHRGRLRAQNDVVVDVERVLHIARRVILWHVEKLEVEKVAFDFRTFSNRKSHAREDIDELASDERERMKCAESCCV